ncbi:MAG TPA: serine hydrolase domain-containing protein [Chitinophagaceae bacterium]|nr:serine hydrolase domain-containing protein [Chitinophagaceae bacterium]
MTRVLPLTCLKVSALFIFLLFFQAAFSQNDFSELNDKFTQYEKALGGKLAIMVYKDGKAAYSKTSTDFLPNTQEPVGSCSKWLTAAVIMTYVDEGKISLDDKVSKYLPIFATYGKAYITVRDCLKHMTGIKGDDGAGTSGGFKSLEDEVTSYANRHDIQTNPGTEFRYSNIGLNIAARIVEIVGKREFEQLAQQRLFRPMGMRSTTYQFDYDKGISPSNGAYSSASDLLNFMGMLLNKGMFKNKRILSEKVVAALEQLQIDPAAAKYTPLVTQGMGYAFGSWVAEQDNNGKPTCFTAPSLTGIWPWLDVCRSYAAIIFVKGSTQNGEKKNYFTDIKQVIDAQLPCNN